MTQPTMSLATTPKLLRVLSGEPVWPPPIWLMRQAGRYLPEYRALRAEAGDFISLCVNSPLAAEVTLQPVRRFDLDAAILFSDILILPWALGHGLRFAEGEGPILPKLTTEAQLNALDLARLPEAIEPILQTVRLVRAALAADKALIGFAGSVFTVACYMVEGGGSREFAATRLMAHGRPDFFAALIDRLVDATIIYLDAQAGAGADVLMLFDSWAGVLPPEQFRRWVIAPTKRIVDALRARRPGLRLVGFPRLAGTMLAEYARETGVDAVGLDTSIDPLVVTPTLPAQIATQGNLDPLLLVQGGAPMQEAAITLANSLRHRPHVFNLGHGIIPQTPPDHVAELVDAVRHG